MSLIVLYLRTRYDIYVFNTLRDITICLFHVTFDLHLWPSAFVRALCTIIIKRILCCWIFLSKMKFVGSVEYEIWTFVWRKSKWRHHDVILNLIFMKFKYKSTRGISKLPTEFQFWFGVIKLRPESREINRKSWRKRLFCFTMTFTVIKGHQFQ